MLRIVPMLFLALTVGAQAQNAAPPTTAASGNLPADFYPKSLCTKPDKRALGYPPPSREMKEMSAYNLKVKKFNDQANAFNACIKTYVDNAQRDIQQIQDVVHAVVVDANQP